MDESLLWRVRFAARQCSANYLLVRCNQLSVERVHTRSHNRCIFVHMVGRDTSHSRVIMKFIYHYTWSRQIIFNSQKLVKRRWKERKRFFARALLLPHTSETKYQHCLLSFTKPILLFVVCTAITVFLSRYYYYSTIA